MRIVSLEKDPENVYDDEAIQVMRINENGDAYLDNKYWHCFSAQEI